MKREAVTAPFIALHSESMALIDSLDNPLEM